jgi:hypothetical protein
MVRDRSIMDRFGAVHRAMHRFALHSRALSSDFFSKASVQIGYTSVQTRWNRKEAAKSLQKRKMTDVDCDITGV